MDLDVSIPVFIHISDGRTHDVNALDLISVQPESIYIMDRGYIDFHRLTSCIAPESALLSEPKKPSVLSKEFYTR